MDVIGRIKMIDSTKEVGSSGFKKREIVITTDEQYPQQILIQFIQDKCDILDGYKVNQSVKVGVNLRGREWVDPQGETKYFNTIQGWRIEKDASEPQQNTNASAVAQYEAKHTATPQQAFEPATDFKEEEHDDLPF